MEHMLPLLRPHTAHWGDDFGCQAQNRTETTEPINQHMQCLKTLTLKI